MRVIGIDTSCDDTSIAIVDSAKLIIAERVSSQDYSLYGGVVPELAHRSHLKCLRNLYDEVMDQSDLNINQIDAIAVTGGPGLIGGLIVGLMFAKGLASASKKKLFIINHLEAHVLSVRLTNNLQFPFLSVLISGGHCQLVLALNIDQYFLIGETLDDALGEAFDKVARSLGLGYPGGAFVEEYAKNANSDDLYYLPMPLCNGKSCDFSFSGLKTAVKNLISGFENISRQDTCDVCASFQNCILNILKIKVNNALEYVRHKFKTNISAVALVGGVASNVFIRSGIDQMLASRKIKLYLLPSNLCTDNGAMIAWNAIEKLNNNIETSQKFAMRFEPQSNWCLFQNP